MSISQMYFTRVGQLGTTAGWQVAAKSGRTSLRMEQEYESQVSGDINALASFQGRPDRVLSLRLGRDHFYLYSLEELGVGLDARTNYFSHCYAFSKESSRGFLKEPPFVNTRFFAPPVGCVDVRAELGLAPGQIAVLEDLESFSDGAAESFDWKQFLVEYRITEAVFKDLLRCVYVAAFTDNSDSLCIQTNLNQEELYQFSRKLMYALYVSLPYGVRARLSFSSFHYPNANRMRVTFCRSQETCRCFFDLATGRHSSFDEEFLNDRVILFCAEHCFDPDREELENYFEYLDQILLDSREEDPLSPWTHRLLLIGADLYTNACESYEESKCISRLNRAVGMAEVGWRVVVDRYVAVLLRRLMDMGWTVNQAIDRRVTEWIRYSESEELRALYIEYSDRNLLAAFRKCQTEEEYLNAFRQLDGLKEESTKRYRSLVESLRENDGAFLDLYYGRYCMKAHHSSFEEISSALQKARESSVCRITELAAVGYMRELFSAKMVKDRSALELFVKQLNQLFPKPSEELKAEMESAYREAVQRYWRSFRWGSFEADELENYVKLEAPQEENYRCIVLIHDYVEQANLHSNGDELVRRMWELLHNAGTTIPEGDKWNVRSSLRRILIDQRAYESNYCLDTWLIAYYKGDCVDFDDMFRNMKRTYCYERAFEEKRMVEFDRSIVLQDAAIKQGFKKYLQESVKKKDADGITSQLIYKLTGKYPAEKKEKREIPYQSIQGSMLYGEGGDYGKYYHNEGQGGHKRNREEERRIKQEQVYKQFFEIMGVFIYFGAVALACNLALRDFGMLWPEFLVAVIGAVSLLGVVVIKCIRDIGEQLLLKLLICILAFAAVFLLFMKFTKIMAFCFSGIALLFLVAEVILILKLVQRSDGKY